MSVRERSGRRPGKAVRSFAQDGSEGTGGCEECESKRLFVWRLLPA